MRTLLIHDADEPPRELRDIVRAGSTELVERSSTVDAARGAADRVVVWRDNALTVDNRQLRWPDDRDEITMLFDTGG